MKMVTKIAYSNMKYHKSKNILIGIAIFLTTLLLFLIPSMGKNMIDGQFAVINEIAPTWHALYRNVDSETVPKLAAHHKIERYGLRSDVGNIIATDAAISMYYLDENGLDLYHMELASGRLPLQENEMVVSEGLLNELGQTGEIGDTVTIRYQIYRNGGLDRAEEKTFVISGFITDGETAEEQKAYSTLVSKAFLEEEIPEEQILYRFLFQVSGQKNATTDAVENSIYQVAAQFGIDEKNIGINKEYLMANYVDPSTIPILAGIMVIIVLAGIITIYSIYYVSMGEQIQEFGKIKAIGATKHQLRQIVLREGMAIALIAVPIGLLVGTILSKFVFLALLKMYSTENIIVTTMSHLLSENRLSLYHWWIYVLAVAVTLITVYLSLLRPMKIASSVSEVEAMRYQGGQKVGKKSRKGYLDITIAKLAKTYLTGNKKKSLITICSMGITGIFLMVIATVLSCANPVESANNSILGQYEISPTVESGNKEHPEREWSSIQQNNPLTEELKEKIEQIEGVDYVKSFSEIYVSSDLVDGEKLSILGVSEGFQEILEKGITQGTVNYEDLMSGEKVILDKNFLYWYPNVHIKVGDILRVVIEDGDSSYEKELEIVAIGDYSVSFTNYCSLIMAKDGVDKLSNHNLNYYYHVFAKENYNEEVENQLQEMIAESGFLQIRTWKENYEEWKSALAMTSGGCYAFLAILGIICVMNMINTMIHNVHIRKKEIGMMQAIGMSDSQLIHMLQLEGLFYTLGTLVLSIGVGSIIGYPVFLWAKKQAILNISTYHYPIMAAIIISLVLLGIQLILTVVLGKSVQKDSLIDRIRFSE